MKKIEDYRKEIDSLDVEIVDLLNKRAGVATEIAKVKKSESSPVFRPDREREVYRKVKGLNKGPLQERHVMAIYREIMSGIIDLENGFEFCYFGVPASFTHQAALSKFGMSLGANPIETIAGVFRAVESGHFEYGVVPIENSTEGVVTHTLDQFLISDLKIYSEIYLKINLCLMSNQKDESKIKYVYSYHHAYAQCRDYIAAHFPHAEFIETTSTSKAAEMVKGKMDSAAIASELAGDLNELDIIRRYIQDVPGNYTRFLVLGYDETNPTDDDRTSIVCSMEDKPGALFAIIEVFAQNNVNMTSIESRPSRKQNWKYNFFIDFDGHRSDDKVEKLLQELAKRTTYLKVLGSYPKGSIPESQS